MKRPEVSIKQLAEYSGVSTAQIDRNIAVILTIPELLKEQS